MIKTFFRISNNKISKLTCIAPPITAKTIQNNKYPVNFLKQMKYLFQNIYSINQVFKFTPFNSELSFASSL
jgi:hypothetical protein